MNEIVEVVNYVDQQCMRHLHLMSNVEFEPACMRRYGAVNGAVTKEAGVWHLRATHPFRGAIDFHGEGWVKHRRLVVWSLDRYPSVKLAFHEANNEFVRLFGGMPVYGFIKRMPQGAEHGQTLGTLILLETEWMLERCVAVGCKE